MTTDTEAEAPPMARDACGEATLEIFAAGEPYNRWLWRSLHRLAPLGGRVLEVGCGIGNVTRCLLAEPGVESVHAIDPEEAYVERLRSSIGDARLTASATSLEGFRWPADSAAEPGRYDRIVTSNVLEHIRDDRAAFESFRDLLRPGGHVLVLVPAHRWLFCDLDRNLSHYRRYERRDLRTLASATGLELVTCRYFNPLGILGWWLYGKLLRRSLLPPGQVRFYSRFGLAISALADTLCPFPLGISLLADFRKPPEGSVH